MLPGARGSIETCGERNGASRLSAQDVRFARSSDQTVAALARQFGVDRKTMREAIRGKAIPQGRHVVAMLTDDDLCKRLLELADQGELVRSKETIAALKAALMSEGK